MIALHWSSMNNSAETAYALRTGRLPRDEVRRKGEVLRENKLLDAILRYVPIFVGVVNEHRQFVVANDEFFRKLGLDEDARLGFRPGEALGCIHAADATDGCGAGPACRYCGALGAVHQAFATGEPVSREARLTTDAGDGMVAWDLRIDAEPIEIDGERLAILMMRDIGSARQKEMLERIFFHDVMNSTASLESVVRLLEPDIPRTGENGDLVDVLKGAAGDVAEQIRYFRKLSQAESGAMEVEWAQIDLDGEVAEVAAAMDQSLRFNERDVSVATKLAGGPIVSDRVLVRRIVLNMLKNAAEASGRGETVTVTTRMSGDRALVSVHNELVMTPEVRNQVFQRSFSTKSRRRGLGTYSMKLLSTRYLGGDVTFVSGEGQGTTFTLTLPVNPPHAPEDSSARNRNLTEA